MVGEKKTKSEQEIQFFFAVDVLISHLFMLSYKAGRQKKSGHFTVRLTVSVYHHPTLQSAFCDFFVCFLSKIMILCVLKRILHKKKSISEIAQAALIVDGYF